MSNREKVEENRIIREIKENKKKGARRARKRNLKLAVICACFSIVVILGAAYIIVHSISDKESLRDAGIAAFNEGNYSEAINNLESSLEEAQWFSKKMDQDTRLYLAAAYMRNSQYDSAAKIYEYLREHNTSIISSDMLNYYLNLSTALRETTSGNINPTYLDNLIKEYDRGNTSVGLIIGTCYMKEEKYDEMLKYYNGYIDEYGINTYIAYQMSTYYLGIDDTEAARSYVNQGLNASDDLYIDKVMYNDAVLYERALDYETAFNKISELHNNYPDDNVYKREYDFLYSRLNIDPAPVHTKGDADEVTY